MAMWPLSPITTRLLSGSTPRGQKGLFSAGWAALDTDGLFV